MRRRMKRVAYLEPLCWKRILYIKFGLNARIPRYLGEPCYNGVCPIIPPLAMWTHPNSFFSPLHSATFQAVLLKCFLHHCSPMHPSPLSGWFLQMRYLLGFLLRFNWLLLTPNIIVFRRFGIQQHFFWCWVMRPNLTFHSTKWNL